MGILLRAHDIEFRPKILRRHRAFGSSSWHYAGLASGERG